MTKANEAELKMTRNTVKELKRLTEEALHNRNSIPLKRRIEELQVKLEEEKSKKKAKLQAKKAANPSGLTAIEERLRKFEAAEQAAVEKLADAADRAKRSLQEYNQLRERGASESELGYASRKVLDHQAKEQKAKDELIEAEKRTQRTLEAQQRSLAKGPSAPSAPPGPSSPPGPSTSVNTTSPDAELMQSEDHGEDMIIPEDAGEGTSSKGKGKGKARAEGDDAHFLGSDDGEDGGNDEKEDKEDEREDENTVDKS